MARNRIGIVIDAVISAGFGIVVSSAVGGGAWGLVLGFVASTAAIIRLNRIAGRGGW